MPTPAEYLISAQHASGGWGYKTGHRSIVEATALALLAIRDEPAANDAFSRGLAWLLGCQHGDGGWGINEEDGQSGWQTAWALLFLKSTNQDNAIITRAAQWLVNVPTYKASAQELTQIQALDGKEPAALVWPWLPGQAGWVEPTALAVSALVDVLDTPLFHARVGAAVKYFEQYRTRYNGWSVGNATVLDTDVLPRAYPTSLVLIALSKVSKQTILAEDVAALRKDIQDDPGGLAHAAGLAATQALRMEDGSSREFLNANQQPDGSWEDNPFVTAWAMIGLRGYL